jgi:hypothetical protein
MLNPAMRGTGFVHSRYPEGVIQSSSLYVSFTDFCVLTYISVGSRAAPVPMNSSDRRRTGRAAATASYLSALWISHQILRLLSASIGAEISFCSMMTGNHTYSEIRMTSSR